MYPLKPLRTSFQPKATEPSKIIDPSSQDISQELFLSHKRTLLRHAIVGMNTFYPYIRAYIFFLLYQLILTIFYKSGFNMLLFISYGSISSKGLVYILTKSKEIKPENIYQGASETESLLTNKSKALQLKLQSCVEIG